MKVIELDSTDARARRDWFRVEQEVVSHDRQHGWERTLESFESELTRPPDPYHRTTRLAAVDEHGTTVGTAELSRPQRDNRHLAGIELQVLPGHRRRGAGSALLEHIERICRADARTTLCSELYLPVGREDEASPGQAFAERFGFASVHQEEHLLLDLPVPDARVAELRATTPASDTTYEIVVWGERCPDEYAAAYCEMRTQMAIDVPMGDLDITPVVFDEERLRASETRLAAAWIPIVAVVRRRSDGEMAGYSKIVLPRGGHRAMQDDTLVMPAHRGRRLGTRLKLATLEVLHTQHPERTALHTWTEPGNTAMLRTNLDFGYVVRERMHELQRKD